MDPKNKKIDPKNTKIDSQKSKNTKNQKSIPKGPKFHFWSFKEWLTKGPTKKDQNTVSEEGL